MDLSIFPYFVEIRYNILGSFQRTTPNPNVVKGKLVVKAGYLYTYNANLFALSEEGGRTDDPRQKVYKI